MRVVGIPILSPIPTQLQNTIAIVAGSLICVGIVTNDITTPIAGESTLLALAGGEAQTLAGDTVISGSKLKFDRAALFAPPNRFFSAS